MKCNFILIDFLIVWFDKLLSVNNPWWWKHIIVHLIASSSGLLGEKDINFTILWDVTLCVDNITYVNTVKHNFYFTIYYTGQPVSVYKRCVKVEIYHDSSKLVSLCQIIFYHT